MKFVGIGGFGGAGACKTVSSKAAAVGVVEGAGAEVVNLPWEYIVTARTCVKFRKDRKIKMRSRGISGNEIGTATTVDLHREGSRDSSIRQRCSANKRVNPP